MSAIAPVVVALLATATAIARAQTVYDAIERAHRPYLSQEDPAGFSMKIRALCASPRALWGGGKDLFFAWAKVECADWLAREEAFKVAHGDVHAGNMGAYASSGKLGELSIGLVDFDDAARLPVEIDLLEACVSLNVAARMNRIELLPSQRLTLYRVMADAYDAAARSNQNATKLLAGDPVIDKRLAGMKKPYANVIDAFTSKGRFRGAIEKSGTVRDILDSEMSGSDQIAAALATAARRETRLKELVGSDDAVAIHRSIRDIAKRTRMGSAGSQGLDKLLVLIDAPGRKPIIVYLKQSIPSAAERSGVVARDARPAAQRVAEAASLLCDPAPLVSTWCEIGEKSYLVTLFEPWSDELNDAKIADFDALTRQATHMGTILGAAHRRPVASMESDLLDKLARRADAYTELLWRQHDELRSDPRSRPHIESADAFIRSRSTR